MAAAEPVASSRFAALRLPGALLALGLVSIVLLFGSRQVYSRSVVQQTSWVQAIGQIRADIAICHLWLEEHVSGDLVDLEEIDLRLSKATSTVEALRGTASTTSLGSREFAAVSADLRPRVDRLAASLQQFRQISADRLLGFERGLAVGIGSSFDVEYDRVFMLLLGDTEALEVAFRELRDESWQDERRSFAAVLALWSLLIVVAAAALWNREVSRRRAEADRAESQAQLLRSQKLDMVGRLAGGLAHDINNYLAAARSQCELVVMSSAEDTEGARRAQSAIGAVGKASDLIDRLLAVSRRQPSKPEVVDLNHLLEEMEGMMRPAIGEDVVLELALAEDLGAVEIDPAQLGQVVINLLVNARDALPNGGRVTLRTGEAEVSGTPHVRLEVADDGVGMSPEIQEQIFEPFWSTKGEQSGHSGLGLSVVQGIVLQAGGHIRVHSSPGRGSRFEILLPRVAAEVAPRDETELSPNGEEGGRILLVDDNEEYREATAALLETLGFDVATAAGAAAALARAEEFRGELDLILIDIVMPEMGGVELWQELQRRHPRLKAVFLSGHGRDSQAVSELPQADSTVVIGKQESSHQLLAAIRQALDAKSRQKDT